MRIVSKKNVKAFWERHAKAETPLRQWTELIEAHEWKTPKDITDAFPRSSSVSDKRIVFRIGGNDYRLVGQISFLHQVLYIRFIGTHAEYDKIDATTVRQF